MFGKRKREISLYIFQKRCTGCESCVTKCRHKVLGMVYKEDRSYATVEYADRCVGCNKCQDICPVNAIEISKR